MAKQIVPQENKKETPKNNQEKHALLSTSKTTQPALKNEPAKSPPKSEPAKIEQKKDENVTKIKIVEKKEKEKINWFFILFAIIFIMIITVIIIIVIYFMQQDLLISQKDFISGKTVELTRNKALVIADDITRYSLVVLSVSDNNIIFIFVSSNPEKTGFKKILSIGEETLLELPSYNVNIKLEKIKNNIPTVTIKKVEKVS